MRINTMKVYVHTTEKRRSYDSLFGFVEAATAKHAGKYTYANAAYMGAHGKLKITCTAHGDFLQSPTNHMQGKGCPKCKHVQLGKRSVGTTAKFVKAATALWGDRWDYSRVEYVDSHAHVRILCRLHGEFLQTPTNHLSGKAACTRCNHMKSDQESRIAQYLSQFTQVVQRDRTLVAPKEVDIYLPQKALAIEYSGMYWHSHFSKEDEKENKRKHFQKYQDCAAKGVRLLTIYESEWDEREPAIRRLLRNAVGKGRGKLMARRCDLKRVSTPEARVFYEKYHPQGGAGGGEHYGLYWRGKLVACMRFAFGNNDRGAGAKKPVWTLGRYATRITVAGAASRLFKAFVQEFHPTEVKSFSDNRYFSGGMYGQLGFVLEEDVAPDYQVWSPKTGLKPKPHYQRRQLQNRLEEHGMTGKFDPATDARTEAEMTYEMGCGRIYDCGKKRWLWVPK